MLHNEDSTSNMCVQFQNNRMKTVVGLWCVEQDQDCGQSHIQTDTHTDNVNTIVSLKD